MPATGTPWHKVAVGQPLRRVEPRHVRAVGGVRGLVLPVHPQAITILKRHVDAHDRGQRKAQIAAGVVGGRRPPVLRSRAHIVTFTRMDREDARGLILREWIRWRNEHIPLDQRPTGIDAKVFYRFLQRKHPDLLDFPCYGDKWVIIHGWLLSPGAVSD